MTNRYADALAVQDACNISGVARSLVETIDDARKNPFNGEIINSAHDPAVILFVYKLASLCGTDYASDAVLSAAWRACEDRR